MKTRIFRVANPGLFLRHPIIGSAVLLLLVYTVFIWLASGIIDDRALLKTIEERASYLVGGDVTIGRVETDLRFTGGWQIRLRDISVENSSPDFGGEVFSCRKIVFEGNTFDFFRDDINARILVKDWIINSSINEYGENSFTELFRPLQAPASDWDGWPFTSIFSHKRRIELQDGQIGYTDAESGKAVLKTGFLQGELFVCPLVSSLEEDDKKEDAAFTFDVNLSLRGELAEGKVDTSSTLIGNIKDFELSSRGLSGVWNCTLEVPEYDLSQFIVACRKLGNPSRNRLSLVGDLKDRDFSLDSYCCVLPENSELGLVRTELSLKNEKSETGNIWTLEVAPQDSSKSLVFSLDETQKPRILKLTAAEFDMRSASAFIESADLDQEVFSLFDRAVYTGGGFNLLGVQVDDAKVELDIADGSFDTISVNGKIAGGAIKLEARGWESSLLGWPKEYGLLILDADARKLVESVSHLLPKEGLVYPSAGKISLGLAMPHDGELRERYFPKKYREATKLAEEKDGDATVGFVRIAEEIRFDDTFGNCLLNSLWNIPEGLCLAEEKCLGKKTPDRKPVKLASLRLTKGDGTFVRRSGRQSLNGFFQTRELGRLTVEEKKGGFFLQVYPFDEDADDFVDSWLPLLRPDIIAAAADVEREMGLRIICRSDKEKTMFDPVYIDDIVKKWKTGQEE